MLCLNLSSGTAAGFQSGPDGCPNDSWIALSPAEFNHYMVSPFKLDLDEAGAICGAVLLVWALAFGLRMAIRALRDAGATAHNDSD